jgi:hypothetical protein
VDEPPPNDCPPINSQTRKISQKFTLLVAETLCDSGVAAVGSLSCLSVTYSLPFFSPSTLFFNIHQLSGFLSNFPVLCLKTGGSILPAGLERFYSKPKVKTNQKFIKVLKLKLTR